MFAYISERNVQSMLLGTLVAVFLISGVILIALRDVRLGIISLIPNLLPAALAFGLWGLLVGQVNMAVAVVAGMALGVVVDDSVHFLSKYQIARRELKLSAHDAVISAFNGVGTALVVTTPDFNSWFCYSGAVNLWREQLYGNVNRHSPCYSFDC